MSQSPACERLQYPAIHLTEGVSQCDRSGRLGQSFWCAARLARPLRSFRLASTGHASRAVVSAARSVTRVQLAARRPATRRRPVAWRGVAGNAGTRAATAFGTATASDRAPGRAIGSAAGPRDAAAGKSVPRVTHVTRARRSVRATGKRRQAPWPPRPLLRSATDPPTSNATSSLPAGAMRPG